MHALSIVSTLIALLEIPTGEAAPITSNDQAILSDHAISAGDIRAA